MSKTGYFMREAGTKGLPTSIIDHVREDMDEVLTSSNYVPTQHEIVRFIGASTPSGNLIQIASDTGPSVFMDNVLNIDLDAQWDRKMYHRKMMEEYRTMVELKVEECYAQ